VVRVLAGELEEAAEVLLRPGAHLLVLLPTLGARPVQNIKPADLSTLSARL
jgi:hypothetical protein